MAPRRPLRGRRWGDPSDISLHPTKASLCAGTPMLRPLRGLQSGSASPSRRLTVGDPAAPANAAFGPPSADEGTIMTRDRVAWCGCPSERLMASRVAVRSAGRGGGRRPESADLRSGSTHTPSGGSGTRWRAGRARSHARASYGDLGEAIEVNGAPGPGRAQWTGPARNSRSRG